MIPFIKKEFITFNDTLYYIVETVRMDDKIVYKDGNINVEDLKESLHADIVLKKEDKFFFLRSIPDLEIITD
jgi:hypothetical protein